MDLSKCLEQLKFDKRMVDWNIQNGEVKLEEVKKHLTTLPDLATQSERLTLEDEGEYSNGFDHQ